MRLRIRAAVSGVLLSLCASMAGVVAPAPAVGADNDMGVFSTTCTFSHANNDDPIVYPGRHDAAHRHHFFGNTSTDYATTTPSLYKGDTTCDRPEDLAAYWVPAVYDRGVELPPAEVHAYYRNTNVKDHSAIVPFPPGLRMIAGTPNHPDAPRGKRTAEWACASGGAVSEGTAGIPATCHGDRLVALITFPSCWDGVRLTTTDQSHMRYPWQDSPPNACPASHPVVLPELTEHVRYDPVTNDQTGLTLSSGPGDSLHADFWNAWDEEELADLVDQCLIGEQQCGTVGHR